MKFFKNPCNVYISLLVFLFNAGNNDTNRRYYNFSVDNLCYYVDGDILYSQDNSFAKQTNIFHRT